MPPGWSRCTGCAHDALQLASGLAVREADPDCTWFACFDQGLRRAAAAERFSLVP